MILSTNFLNKSLCQLMVVCCLLLCSSWVCADSLPEKAPAIKTLKVAVLPPENLSSVPVNLKGIRHALQDLLATQGVILLEEASLDRFITKHRLRYTGGIDAATAKTLSQEEAVDAVLISSVELYNDSNPPKMAIIARLVSTGAVPTIRWTDTATLVGNENPGLLGMGLIDDPQVLQKKVLTRLTNSLASYLSGKSDKETNTFIKRLLLKPKIFFGKQFLDQDQTYSVAIVPFSNESTRKYAGEILLLHFVRQLHNQQGIRVIEPGIVRDRMLSMRAILEGGLSRPTADSLANSLDADFILTGKVFVYEDFIGPEGAPSVDFSVQLIERSSREVIWSSNSYNKGDEGVVFFDWGRLYTASQLASGMTKSVVDGIIRYASSPATHDNKADPKVEKKFEKFKLSQM